MHPRGGRCTIGFLGPPLSRRCLSFLLVACVVLGACSSDPGHATPTTDVFLARVEIGPRVLRVLDFENLTRRNAYDNQPVFVGDGSAILFSRSDGNQNDIFRYDLEQKELSRVTLTLESEYSPQPIPGDDGFSTVRVETDGRQRLWRFGPDGGAPLLLMESPDFVGYYAWADETRLVMHVLGNPTTLVLGDTGGRALETVARNVGRSVQPVPGTGSVSFVHKRAEDEWWICLLDLLTGEIRDLVRTLPGSEDFAWAAEGTILMAEGPVLFQWSEDSGLWAEVQDFSAAGLLDISRIAVSPTGEHLALVAEH